MIFSNVWEPCVTLLKDEMFFAIVIITFN